MDQLHIQKTYQKLTIQLLAILNEKLQNILVDYK